MATPLYPTNYITPISPGDPIMEIPENNPVFQSIWGPNGTVNKSRSGAVNPTNGGYNGGVQSISFGGPNPTNKIPGINWPSTVNATQPGTGSVNPSSTVGSLANDTVDFGSPYQQNPLLNQVPSYGQLPTYNQLPSYGPQATMDQFQQQSTQPSLGIRPQRRYNRLPQLMSGQFQYY